MSDFTDFMTMKIIEWRRSIRGGIDNKEFEVALLEQCNGVKNLNVRAPIHTIAQIETLANWAGVSKAELVLEMLSSCISDATEMIAKEGKLEQYHDSLYKHLESDFGAIISRDEDGNIRGFGFKPQNKVDSEK